MIALRRALPYDCIMTNEYESPIDLIAYLAMRDFTRTPLTAAIAAHNNDIDDLIDAMIDDDYALDDELYDDPRVIDALRAITPKTLPIMRRTLRAYIERNLKN